MIERAEGSRQSVRQLVLVMTAMAIGCVCIRTLRFTRDGWNLAFVCAFFVVPFFAVRPVLRLRRWPRLVATGAIVPVLALSTLFLLTTVSCDIPALVEKRQLRRELSSTQQVPYSVHLVWEETAGGAVGPHGVVLEQRMTIVPGLYVVKYLDYFEGVHEGRLSVEGPDRVRLHIPNSNLHGEADRLYSLKRRVYF